MEEQEEWFYRSLTLAIRKNSVKKVRLLLETHPEARNFFYHDQAYKLLVYALHKKRIEIVKYFIQYNCLVQMVSETKFYYTPLYYAVKMRDINLVKLFLNKNAPINDQDRNKETALLLAYKIRFLEAVKLMLSKYFKQNRNLSICSDNDMTAFFIACLTCNENAIKGFFNYGFYARDCETIAAIKQNNFDLHYAVTNEYLGLVNLVANERDEIVKKNQNGLTPLHLAFLTFTQNRIHKSSCLQMLDSMLSPQTALIENCVEQNGISHFHIACTRSNINVIKNFLNYGADVNKPISFESNILSGYTPLHCAADFKNTIIIPLLLKNNANINVVDKEGYTPLHLLFLIYERSKSENKACRNLIMDIFSKYYDKIKNSVNKYGLSHFHIACALGDVTVIKEFIKKGANINKSITDASEVLPGYSPLHCSVAHNNVKAAKLLLQCGANINAKNTDGLTSLHIVYNNWKSKKYKDEVSERFIDLLLSLHGEKNENTKDKNGLSHFHIACMRNDVEVVEEFIKQGVDINDMVVSSSTEFFKCTPLVVAVYFNKLEIVKLLLRYNANVNTDNDVEIVPKTPVFAACTLRKKQACNQIDTTCNNFIMYIKSQHPLNKLFIYDNQEESDKFNWDDNFEIIHLLLKHGSNVNILNSFNKEPMIFNLCTNDLYKKILVAFNSLNEQYKKLGFDYLTELVCDNYYAKHNEIIKLFINHGFNLKLCNLEGYTLVHCLAQSLWEKDKSIELLQFILEKGFDVNIKTNYGFTPLHIAALHHNEEIVKLLLKFNAEVNSTTNDIKTPLSFACEFIIRYKFKYKEIIHLLVNNGADVNAKDKNGQTPLFESCSSDAGVFCELLKLGADIDVWDKNSNSVIDVIDTKYFIINNDLRDLRGIHDHILAMQLLNSKKKNFISEKLYRSLMIYKRKHNNNKTILFLNECKNEIDYMKSVKVDSYSTLYDLIFKNKNEMSIYMKNNTFKKILNSNDFETKLKYYGFLLKNKFQEGTRRNVLLKPAKRLLTFIINVELPDSCSENIFKYFTDDELKILLKFI